MKKNNISKNFKFLSLFNLFNVEKYLQEIVTLSFEYASEFIFSYNINDFKNIPINCFPLDCDKNSSIGRFLCLINLFLEKDIFFNPLYLYSNLKFKIKFSHFVQILGLRGRTEIDGYNKYILSNLNYGFSLKDFILSSFKTRKNIIDSSVNVASSGYLTRKLVEGLRDMSIKEIKCTTKYTCKNMSDNCNINLPFFCYSNHSICSFCFDIINDDSIFLGYNKGIISGQALGEPSTQMLLRAFHLGGGGFGFTTSYQHFEFSTIDTVYNNNIDEIYDDDEFNFINVNNYINSKILYKNIHNYIKFNFYNKIKTVKNYTNLKFLSLFKNFNELWSSVLFNWEIFKCKTNYNKNLNFKKFLTYCAY